MRIALIEDNESLARGIENALQDQGHAVDWLQDGLAGSAFLETAGADVAIIDVNLPGRSGLEIVRALRAKGDATPVLILTAMGKTSDRVTGLDAGADDYLVKPFEMAELTARLRALNRRRPTRNADQEPLGTMVYDRRTRQISGPDGPLPVLPRRELALLDILLDHRGRILAKERIADALYGTGADIDANAVELLVSRLRRKLEGTGVMIRTARGLGYMLDDGTA